LSQFGVILALIFSLIIAIFAIANNQLIEVNYLYGKAEVSAIVVILGAAILGALVIFLLSMFRQIRMSFQIRSLRNELESYKNKTQELEKERERLVTQADQSVEASAGGQAAVALGQDKAVSPPREEETKADAAEEKSREEGLAFQEQSEEEAQEDDLPSTEEEGAGNDIEIDDDKRS